MKKIILAVTILFALIITACNKKNETTVQMYAVNNDGIGQNIGTVKIEDNPGGLIFKVDIRDLGGASGAHGFHVHTNGACGNTAQDGSKGAALAAGGHYDPAATGKHLGPYATGHKGDLPHLQSVGGAIVQNVSAPNLTLNEIKGRTLMIHAGGDNYSDAPVTLGGGGARIACGVIE